MPHSPHLESDQANKRFPIIDNSRWFACGMLVAVFSAAASLNGFSDMWKQNARSDDPLLFGAKAALFAVLASLAFRWVLATHQELILWLDWLDNAVERHEVYGAMFGLGIVLGLSLAFVHHVVFIMLFLSAAMLFNYWTQWLANDQFARSLERTRSKHLSAQASRVLEVMERYWIGRAQLGRLTTGMFFACMAFSLALAGATQNGALTRQLYLAAYGLMCTDIFVCECVVAVWRHQRNKEIDRILGSKESRAHAAV
jgi:hypothetical protein